MSKDLKSSQAFPGRTGMGYEKGLSKLEYIAALMYAGNNAHCNVQEAVERAIKLLKLCAEAENAK